MNNKLIEFKPDKSCDNCGRYGAFDLGDEHLCSDCYQERGSCCLEFGDDDLWKDKEKESETSEKDNNS